MARQRDSELIRQLVTSRRLVTGLSLSVAMIVAALMLAAFTRDRFLPWFLGIGGCVSAVADLTLLFRMRRDGRGSAIEH
jgi:hypothetical protein